MPALPLAAVTREPLELYIDRCPGAAVPRLWDRVEHVRDEGPLPRLPAPVAVDVVFAVCRMVAACGLVRRGHERVEVWGRVEVRGSSSFAAIVEIRTDLLQ